MKLTHNIIISVFVKENDDEEKTTKTMVNLLPSEFEKEKIKVGKETVRIETGVNMKILRIKIIKERQNKQIITKLKEMLGKEQCEMIAEDESRIDADGMLYIRLDRNELENNNQAKIVDHGECYHIKIMLATFPKTKEKAIAVAKQLFE